MKYCSLFFNQSKRRRNWTCYNKKWIEIYLTPCVLLKKSVANHNLEKIVSLLDNELTKAFVLFMSLFSSIAYKRRFEIEKNNTNNGGIGICLMRLILGKFPKLTRVCDE